MENERLQREKQFCSKNYLSEMTCSHTKMCLKSALKEINFVIPLISLFFIYLFIYLLFIFYNLHIQSCVQSIHSYTYKKMLININSQK